MKHIIYLQENPYEKNRPLLMLMTAEQHHLLGKMYAAKTSQ